MKIRIEQADETEVVLRCPTLNDEMLHILSLLQSGSQRLCAWDENRQTLLLSPDEILYAESVEEKTFLYGKKQVLQTALTLAELESRYEQTGYCRVSKSMVANLNSIRALKSHPGGRIEAAMENGERIMVSRHYAPFLRERLGLKGER